MKVKKGYLLIFLIGIICSTGVILFDHFSKQDPQSSLDQAFDALEDQYRLDSLRVVDEYLEGGMVSQELEESAFDISVLGKGDTLLYWNATNALSDTSSAPHWQKSFVSSGKLVLFSLDLFEGRKLVLDDSFQKERDLQYDYVYNSKGKYKIPFAKNEIKLSITSPYVKSKWHSLFIGLWYLSILFIGLFIIHLYKQSIYFGDGLLSSLVYTVIMLGFGLAAGYIAPGYLFGAHSLSVVKEGSQINLLTFTSILLTAYFLVEGLDKKALGVKWRRIPLFARYLIGSLAANILLMYMVWQAESFLMSGTVQINIEEILKFDAKGLYFLLMLMGYCMVYYYMTAMIYQHSEKERPRVWQRIIAHGLGVVSAALLVLWLGIQTPTIPLVLFIVAYFLILDLYEEFNAKNLTFLLINTILFSAFLSVVIFYASLRKDKLDRKSEVIHVFNYLSENDKSRVENMRDTLISSNLIPSVASLSWPSPMDRYELTDYIENLIVKADNTKAFDLIGLECYDQSGNSLFFNYISNFQLNNTTIANSQKLSSNIYHLPLRSITSIFFQIENLDFPNSPINMIIKLQKQGGKSLQSMEDKNYLVYKEDKLIYTFSNDFLDINNIDPSSLVEDVDIGDMSYIVYAPDAEYKVIDYHEVAGLIKPISFFSMIFILVGLLIVLMTIINSRYDFLPKELGLKFYNQSSLRSKIQLSVILLIVFSFVVIGVITTVYFKNIVSSNDRTTFKSELRTIINDVQNKLTETVDSEAASNIMAKEFSELENIYGRLFAYYNQEGELIIKSASFDNIYNRLPYNKLQSFKAATSTSLKPVSQQMGDDQVLIPIYLTENRPIGYLSMNYTSDTNISNGIFNHLGNLMNVYIFLFFLAGAISIFIANSITKPLAKLREGVKKFKLGRANKPLEYHSSDELGVLIKEYNAMTEQLEKSAQIIAKTERDMAWREMAKQVAHEIKNPLTPMKLHIQHLENTVNSSPERAQEMIKKVSSTLIEQINNLSNIASEFSNYATLPKADNHRTDLNEVVEHVHDLFRERDDMDIYMNEPIEDLIVFADRNHLVRIMVNIIKNAIQSIPQERRGKIDIELSKVDNQAKIVISDNGVGIPDRMKDKIFTPNFTTKSSGTGLGLAICVNMLDTMNGKIYFESKEGRGTQFFIEIPIMRTDLPKIGGGQVFLD